MDRIKLHDKTFKKYIPYDTFIKDIDRVAEELNRDFRDSGEIPVVICVLNGSLPFTAEILRRLDFLCELSSLKVSSYSGMSTQGEVVFKQPLTCDVKGRTVILVEDIVDSGYTMDALTRFFKEQGVKETKICTLFFKEEAFRFKGKFDIDYIARNIQNQFIVGFGLDYDELGRNLKDIYILDEDPA